MVPDRVPTAISLPATPDRVARGSVRGQPTLRYVGYRTGQDLTYLSLIAGSEYAPNVHVNATGIWATVDTVSVLIAVPVGSLIVPPVRGDVGAR